MEFTQEELKAIRAEYAKGSTDTQFDLFISECKSRNLRPGTHLIFQIRRTKGFDADSGSQIWVAKPYWITTISALRLIIERTGKYAGQTEPEYVYLDADGQPTIFSKIPLAKKGSTQTPLEPWVVRVGIKRRDFDEPIYGMARFESVAGLTKEGSLTSMWSKRGPEMCAKCAEADGIRKAAPEEAGSFYIAEELKNETEEAPQPQVVLAPAPTAPVVPPVSQVPAEPTTEPRPNEPIPTLEQIVLHKEPNTITYVENKGTIDEAVITVSTPVDTKPKATRKKAEPKPEPIPNNGKIDPLGITDADIDNLENPVQKETPEEKAQRKKEAQEFAEDVCSVTPVPDRLPTEEQGKAYVARARELVKTQGVSNTDVGKYVLGMAGKFASKELTVGNWDSAFEKLDAATAAGTLKELVKQ